MNMGGVKTFMDITNYWRVRMKWYGHMCISDVPLGDKSPPFDDPRYLSKKLSDDICEYYNARYSLLPEKNILIYSLERFVNGECIKLEELREASGGSFRWQETAAYNGVIWERGT